MKWSKKPHIRGVETSIMPIGITNILILSNVSDYINKHSFISVRWIYSCNELNRWQNYYISSIIISNSQIEILFSYSSFINVKVYKSFPNSKFEGNFSTNVFGKSFWHYRELKIEYWISRHLLCEKILNNS
jgi:hypothetical protein